MMNRKSLHCIFFSVAVTALLLSAFPVRAERMATRGIYGVPPISRLNLEDCISDFSRGGVNAVFVPAEEDTIAWFKKRGFAVFVSVNAFGGKGAWKHYPDSRPVKADGTLLGSGKDPAELGGVCPTHPQWRKERLKQIESLVGRFKGKEKIDGIWLDFIRYPGYWEVRDPVIPDTCYCPRCLKQFQENTGIAIPRGNTKDQASWIKKNCRYRWMNWKKTQIATFVKEVRNILDGNSDERPGGEKVKLGLFIVPFTKGEHGNAVSYELAQDAFALSDLVDVLSPMVYHGMCGQPESWVGKMTQYYRETARCQVWPIIQSEDCSPAEFENAVKSAGLGGADGILVYSFRGMKPDLWSAMKLFQAPVNLLVNPQFKIMEQEKVPYGWHTGKGDKKEMVESVFLTGHSNQLELKSKEPANGPYPCVGIKAGNDGAGEWFSRIPPCDPGKEYLFTGLLYRRSWQNGVYPAIKIWGQEILLNSHWLTRKLQPVKRIITCPDKAADNTFRFINYHQNSEFWIAEPSLTEIRSLSPEPPPEPAGQLRPADFYPHSFPIGVYGASLEDFAEVKRLALNTVLIGGKGDDLKKKVEKCHELGLRYVISVPHDPDRLPVFLDEIAGYVRPYDMGFYVNDEPGIHSFPVNRANDMNRLLKERFPRSPTCMAVVRPQVCRFYNRAADFFLLDQYPVPHMPMAWLSDSMEEAGLDVGLNRVGAVIQAFGGETWAEVGWPRLPTWEEMDCLSFLSVVHGGRAIFFYTYSVMGKTEEGREQLARVVGKLNRVYPWLVEKNLRKQVPVRMVSKYGVDPSGRPAVHCCLKKKDERYLLLVVNTIHTAVSAVIQTGYDEASGFNELFSEALFPSTKGTLSITLGPYETKAFEFSRKPQP